MPPLSVFDDRKIREKNLESAVSIFALLLPKLDLTRLFVRFGFGGAQVGILEANGNERKIWLV